MDRKQPMSKSLACHHQMAHIGPVEAHARVAVASRIDRAGIRLESCGLEVYLTFFRCPGRAVSGVPRGGDAVEHIASSRDRFQEVIRVAHPHQVTGPVRR